MKLKAPINENYAATVVTIKNLIVLENCANVVHTSIFGNLVVVGKDTYVGEKGLYFPAETRLSDEFLHNNNLYRDNTKNKTVDEKGYFEDNGRIRCVKFRGHKSEGLFIPLGSLLFCTEAVDIAALQEGATFDQINGLTICEKYIPRTSRTPSTSQSTGKDGKKPKKVNRIVDGQFRFHSDTSQLGKNIWKVKPDSIISITNKLHGSSFVVSKILCRKKLKTLHKFLKKLGVPIVDTHYDGVYSSRKVIKNDDLNRDYNHFYKEDLWRNAYNDLEDFLLDGMTIYGEIVGFASNGASIQGGYDYDCNPKAADQDGKPYKLYIYRITLTTVSGQVVEFSAKQVQDWCKEKGLKAVPEYFYGKASDISVYGVMTEEQWQSAFLDKLLGAYNMEKDCEICKNKVPAEGFVLRIEGLEYDAYKLKSFRFRERETKELDKGTVDIETEESQGGE